MCRSHSGRFGRCWAGVRFGANLAELGQGYRPNLHRSLTDFRPDSTKFGPIWCHPGRRNDSCSGTHGASAMTGLRLARATAMADVAYWLGRARWRASDGLSGAAVHHGVLLARPSGPTAASPANAVRAVYCRAEDCQRVARSRAPRRSPLMPPRRSINLQGRVLAGDALPSPATSSRRCRQPLARSCTQGTACTLREATPLWIPTPTPTVATPATNSLHLGDSYF